MVNQTIEEAKDYLATIKDIEQYRVEYVKDNNGWLESAIQYDPALAKYIDESLISKIQNPKLHRSKYEDELKEAADKIRTDLQNTTNPQMELLSYPGLTAMAAHEKASELYHQALEKEGADQLADFAAARRISEAAKTMSGIDIHPGADIDSNLFIDHGTGVVIGETAIIGKNCFLLHGVTLGGGNLKDGNRRHPKLGDGVTIGSNSNIYGACDIGDDVAISTGVNIIDSNVSKKVQICAGSRVTQSNVGKGAVIYPEAQVFNCVIGEGAKIGAGVRIENVIIPPYAEVHDLQTPKLAIYTDKAEHQGNIVMARPQDKEATQGEQTLREAFMHAENYKKAVRAAEYIDSEEIIKVPDWQDMLGIIAAQRAKEQSSELSPSR
jgi:serine O-acetyltransferase